MTTFRPYISYRVSVDGSLERRVGQMPAVVSTPPVAVSIDPELSPREAARLLRVLVDALEAQP